MKKFLEIIKNKWLIKGTTTILLIAIIIAVYTLLNWGIGKLKLEDIDCTTTKINSLSEETKSKVKGIEKEITIQLINLSQYEYYVDKYTKITDKIKVDKIDDLSSRIDLMNKYNLQSTDRLMVVKTEENEQVLTADELYTYNYYTGQTIDRVEEAITNAIVELTLNEKTKIYILSGKAYYNPNQAFYTLMNKLKEDGNEIEYIDILSAGSIPEDCNCLIITTLAQDLVETERDQIINYINKGGKIMMLTVQHAMNVKTPNLSSILDLYGISIKEGIILEQDSNKKINNAPLYIVEQASASFMNKLNMEMKASLYAAGKIEFAEQEKLDELGVQYEEIITTGEKSFVRTDFSITTFDKTDKDSEEGSNIAGALVTKKISDEISSKLIIYTSELFASDLLDPAISYQYPIIDQYNNKDVVLNSISYLTEREDTITIRKTQETDNYTVTEEQDTLIRMIIFVVPVIVIIFGIVVWQVRRRKK